MIAIRCNCVINFPALLDEADIARFSEPSASVSSLIGGATFHRQVSLALKEDYVRRGGRRQRRRPLDYRGGA